jgi:hypothetical protein
MRRVEEGSSAFSVISGSVAMLLFIAIMGLPVQRALGWPTSTNYQRIRLHQADYFVLIPALLLAAPVGMAGYVLVRRLELPFLAAYLAAVLIYAASLVPLLYLAHCAVSTRTFRSYLEQDSEFDAH